jgi:MoxR-like ATPase
VFGNLVLADEINRAPPKTQAALLQAMQELAVTAGGTTHELEEPFLVLATQNPIEQEGTYALPEAQLDRFMFNIQIGYPDEDEEVRVISETTSTQTPSLEKVADAAEIAAMAQVVRAVPVAEPIVRYAARLARASRAGVDGAPEFVSQWVKWGAGPRAGQCLILGAKAAALFRGGVHVTSADVERVAAAVLRHRILTNFHAEAEGVGVDEIIRRLLEEVPRPADTA